MLTSIKLNKIVDIAKKAGNAIMEIYQKDFRVEYKDDQSPLTEADTKANDIICSSLKELYPDIPIMSEENKQIDYQIRKGWEYYWCIDPIDGTKEFIKKNNEFTINIALIHNNIPVLGVVYAPAIDEMYKAKKGEGAYKNNQRLPLNLNTQPEIKLTVVTSKSHLSKNTQSYIDSLKTQTLKQISKGSSLKLCMVAEGIADLYPRLATTMEWDTAAADSIVRESGKRVVQFKNHETLVYNKKYLQNPWFLVLN